MPSITILEIPTGKGIDQEVLNQLKGLVIDLTHVISNAHDDYWLHSSCIEKACANSPEPRELVLEWLSKLKSNSTIALSKVVCQFNS